MYLTLDVKESILATSKNIDMPNTKAAKKALRQNKTNRVRNLRQKRGVSEVIKDYKSSVDLGDAEAAKTKLSQVYKKLDKAAKTNLIKKNKAARLKSRLTSLLSGKKAPTEEVTAPVAPALDQEQ
ncbi:MAG: 30S ribosomal protein S20 [Candidatus Colwellbacteria bacterium CG10_big_fil_rev_8_21_14_0_10_41_28]|uniref:Small ribosomal subunit protein bS20 n=1 Tax=Candidatus Colwellbacteria bacterium CG10_big_fil_rev_8_21_14_0_10_41_28 TaxID=1974539 RepID=A0A2H0VJW6_9BACT|nr:MAG: 30S ribosomal protein S20 [Candidatus Colwellbacteria bacterium CG10_big_fil_rev_8_21_14_0_10_41_28]